ncbi:MAG: AMP-binding protein [Puniceicoccales bacterium]|nr:AMP-binding protein [Puniceicoccales bacterium]
MRPATANVARHLRLAAQGNPNFCAVKVPVGVDKATGTIRYTSRSFAELDRESAAAAALFVQHGISPGTRTLLLARPGLDLLLSMFALLKLGAVPVAIDPGMGLRAFLCCVRNTRPEALVGSPFALAMTRLFPSTFRCVRTRVRIACTRFARDVVSSKASPDTLFDASPDSPAAILFTSGSTGAPKGVCYTHGMLDAQLALVRDAYAIQPGEVDLPMLPVFALFNPALGTTTITPEMNPSRPAFVDPRKIIHAITQDKVTYSFGSPALWSRLARYCARHGVTLPSVRCVLVAGAPVHPRLLHAMRAALPNAAIHTPYGATESLPVTSIEATEIIHDTWQETLRGGGTCVGYPLPGVCVKIIPLSDTPLGSLIEAGECPAGGIGEIIVRSASTSREYDNNAEATAMAKIPEGDGVFWHRMGDLGRLDAKGRLWFLGRKAERVTTPQGILCTEACEAIFNVLPEVFRTALIGLGAPGAQEPILLVEPFPESFPNNAAERARFVSKLLQLGAGHEITRQVQRIFFEKKFPVDVRHNAKIHRLALRRKYARQLKAQ